MTKLAIYLFGHDAAQAIATRTINGERWFMALDICNLLGISNHSTAVHGKLKRKPHLNLSDGECRLETTYIGNYGKDKILLVNELGMLKLIFKGKAPRALEVQERARQTPENLKPASWSEDILGR